MRIDQSTAETDAVLGPRVARRALYKSAVMLAAVGAMPAAAAEESMTGGAVAVEGKIRALLPELARYVTRGMAAFDVPGAAVGVIAGDRLVYAKGFGYRRKGDSEPVGARTVFQIG